MTTEMTEKNISGGQRNWYSRCKTSNSSSEKLPIKVSFPQRSMEDVCDGDVVRDGDGNGSGVVVDMFPKMKRQVCSRME